MKFDVCKPSKPHAHKGQGENRRCMSNYLNAHFPCLISKEERIFCFHLFLVDHVIAFAVALWMYKGKPAELIMRPPIFVYMTFKVLSWPTIIGECLLCADAVALSVMQLNIKPPGI